MQDPVKNLWMYNYRGNICNTFSPDTETSYFLLKHRNHSFFEIQNKCISFQFKHQRTSINRERKIRYYYGAASAPFIVFFCFPSVPHFVLASTPGS